MLMVGGMAVDLMRFEVERKRVQHTIDNAVLAASSLSQQEDAEAIARSFFEKNGYDPDSFSVVVDETTVNNGTQVISRSVTASSDIQMGTWFMNLSGIDNLQTGVGSAANETIQNIEISLVLDISGSMRWGVNNSENANNRIDALKSAVYDFVDIVMDVQCNPGGNNCTQSPDSASTTINVIPYAGHVNPGPTLFNLMGGDRWHNWSSCLEVASSDLSNPYLPSSSDDQLPHFMRWTIDTDTMNWGWCPKDDAAILVAENDAETIKDFVRDIRLHDGTATHIGMKYGVALLHPSSRDEFAALHAAGEIATEYQTRPADFDENVVKYLIVMTDGQITDQYRPSDAPYADIYSFDPETDDENDPDFSAWAAVMDRYGSVDSTGSTNSSSAVEQGYPSTTKYRDEDNVQHNRSRNITNFLSMCDEAKEAVTLPNGDVRGDRITVFSIAFLAPSAARDQMRQCASSADTFWDVQDLNLNTSFRAIAMTINKLRLTQ